MSNTDDAYWLTFDPLLPLPPLSYHPYHTNLFSIYGPAVCDHGLPTYRRQIYAATLSNPTGQPLSLYICLTEGVVREEIVDRLHWMGGVVEEDPEKADMYLANAHSELTKVRTRRMQALDPAPPSFENEYIRKLIGVTHA